MSGNGAREIHFVMDWAIDPMMPVLVPVCGHRLVWLGQAAKDPGKATCGNCRRTKSFQEAAARLGIRPEPR